jgi:hypothetical protein
MSLIEWHERLSANFRRLHESRTANAGGPIFALEHGLSQQELSQLENDVRAYIQKYPPTENSWLTWIIYAAELGYRYVGLEYWQTFEAETVGWTERGRGRNWIRNKFKLFERDFGGAVPSGLWAEHFSIICHPITHAILPRDFQSQLAEVLWTIQHLFTVENLQEPKLLGQLIQSHSSQQRTRFQQFVQDFQMVGLITQALLGDEEDQTGKILLPETLSRIVDDLEGVSLDQLRDARHRAYVTRLRGLTGARGERILRPGDQERGAQDHINVKPSLLLRRSGATAWDVYIEIPDFSALVTKHPHWLTFLERTRATINGTRVMLSRGKLLFGLSTVQLRSYPDPQKPLLTFENDSPDDLMRYLNHNFSLEIGSTLLCRIANDGRGHEMTGNIVRPGREYLILSTSAIRMNAFASHIDLSCEGLNAVRLSVPQEISRECRTAIESLGLKIVGEVSVFPVGVTAAKWDDEGYGEWLTTDNPCIGVRSDHWIAELRLELDDEEGTVLQLCPSENQNILFMQLPTLDNGSYLLSLSARASPNEDFEDLGQLRIRIRDPRPWKSVIQEQGALIAVIDPRQPTFEQLTRGDVGVEIHGPVGHRVSALATLLGKNRRSKVGPLFKLPDVRLPFKLNSGRAYLGQLAHNPEFLIASDSATACKLDFNAEELGAISFVFDREFAPLRWVIKRENNSYFLTLSDDSGATDKPVITHYDFSSPDRGVPISYDSSFDNREVPATGGLYFARGDEAQCGIIFPHLVSARLNSFADMKRLTIQPRFRSRERSTKALLEELALMRIWSEARTTGNIIALLARQRVLQAFIAYIFGVISGPRWAGAELTYMDSPHATNASVQLSKAIESSGVAARLLRASETMNECTPKTWAVELATVVARSIKPVRCSTAARRTGVVVSKGGRWQAEFALRLATMPESLDYWARDWLIPGLQGLLDNALLARAARFIVLTSSYELRGSDSSQTGSLYEGWDWI